MVHFYDHDHVDHLVLGPAVRRSLTHEGNFDCTEDLTASVNAVGAQLYFVMLCIFLRAAVCSLYCPRSSTLKGARVCFSTRRSRAENIELEEDR